MLYTNLMGLLIIFEIALTIAAVNSHRFVVDLMQTKLSDTIIQYRDDPDLQFLVDWIQINMKCCGSAGPDDWGQNIYFRSANLATTFLILFHSKIVFPKRW